MTPGSFTLLRPQWRFWRGVLLGFLSGCVVSYAVARNTSHIRVHHVDPVPEYVVASARR